MLLDCLRETPIILNSRKPSVSAVQDVPYGCLTIKSGRGLKGDRRFGNDVARHGSKRRDNAHSHQPVENGTEEKEMMMGEKMKKVCESDRKKKRMANMKEDGRYHRRVRFSQ